MFISDRVNIAWPSSATATTVRKEPESWEAVSECMMLSELTRIHADPDPYFGCPPVNDWDWEPQLDIDIPQM